MEPGDIDRYQSRGEPAATTVLPAGLSPEHQHPAIRREGRTLHQVAFRQDAFAGTVRVHYADGEVADLAAEARKGDQVTAWRPDRRRIPSGTEADAPGPTAARPHHI